MQRICREDCKGICPVCGMSRNESDCHCQVKPADDRWGALKVDANQMTSMPGVFSGGDASRGASLVVHAVKDARKAALGIDQYLHEAKAAN